MANIYRHVYEEFMLLLMTMFNTMVLKGMLLYMYNYDCLLLKMLFIIFVTQSGI